MTDGASGAAAPPKKRSFFKKAAWQTAPKAEADKEHDMFSHSNEFRDIVAEETQRKNEERKRLEEARKRKVDEERKQKRRKISSEVDEEKMPGSGSPGSARGSRNNKGHSKSPLSPIRNGGPPDTLSNLYDSLANSSSTAPIAQSTSQIIDLGDSDDDYTPINQFSPISLNKSIPSYLEQRAPSEDLEEAEDPTLAALKARARARAAEKAAKQEQDIPSTAEQPKTAVVQILITSTIPNTKPLFVKVRTDTTIEKPREAWCAKQGFSSSQTKDIFMTFRMRKVFDYTTIQRLGINVDDSGNVTIDGDPTIYDEANLPKLHLDAWTAETFEQRKREDAEEAAVLKKAAEASSFAEELEPEPEPESEGKKIRLFLKAKGKEDFKIFVHRETSIGHLAAAYKQNRGIPEDQPITLMFDGDRLPPIDTIADTDIDDMDAIDVHFK